MTDDELNDLMERAQQAAGEVLNDGFHGQGVVPAAVLLHVAVQPEHPEPEGWQVFVMGRFPAADTLDELEGGDKVRHAIAHTLQQAAASLRPPPPPRPLRTPQAPV